MSTVQLGILVSYQETINKFNEMPLKAVSGKKALEIRKTIKKLQEEVKAFNEARDQYITENGEQDEQGNYSINKDEDVVKAQKFLDDMVQAEVEVTWNPVIDEDTLDKIGDHVEFTINDLDFFEEAGLLQLDEVIEPEIEEV